MYKNKLSVMIALPIEENRHAILLTVSSSACSNRTSLQFELAVVKTSSSFHIDFQETLRFDPASFADASDFIQRADNALRTV